MEISQNHWVILEDNKLTILEQFSQFLLPPCRLSHWLADYFWKKKLTTFQTMNKYNQLELLSKISSDIDIIRLTKFIHCIMEDLKHDQKNSSKI